MRGSMISASGRGWAAGFSFGLTLGLLFAGVACGGDVDRESYTADNHAVLAEVPVYHGARQLERADIPYEGVAPPIWFRGPDIEGYTTEVFYGVEVSAAELGRFFRQAFLAAGWELVAVDQQRLRFRKGKAGVTLRLGEFVTPIGELTGSGYTLELDDDRYRRCRPPALPPDTTPPAPLPVPGEPFCAP